MEHKILLIVCYVGLLFACDTRLPWATRDNSPPVMLFLKNSQTTLTDSTKLSLKVREKKEISVAFSALDDNHNLGSVSIVRSGGDDAVTPVRESLPLTLDGKFTATFTVVKNGTSVFTLTAEDKLGGRASLTYQVVVFDNLPPVASFVVLRPAKSADAGTYVLDASSSADKDTKYGGALSYYRFTIHSLFDKKTETFLISKPTQAYSFISEGQFTVALEVIDNDGGKDSTEKNVTIEF